MLLRKKIRLPIEKNLFLSIVGGSEAGLSTTTAVIGGAMIGTNDRRIVLISSIIAFFVQAFNSAMTGIIKSQTNREIDNDSEKDSIKKPLSESGLEFLMHVTTSFIVILPIAITANLKIALLSSIGLALMMLFLIGLYVGVTVKHRPIKNAFHSVLTGALVISAGILVGLLFDY